MKPVGLEIRRIEADVDAALLCSLDALLVASRDALVGAGEHLAPVAERIADAAADEQRILCAACLAGLGVGIVDASLHSPSPGDLTISQLAVAHDHRFRGIASALVRAALQEAEARARVERACAAVRRSAPGALAFWLALGFDLAGGRGQVHWLERRAL